jgi:hypothetical protein
VRDGRTIRFTKSTSFSQLLTESGTTHDAFHTFELAGHFPRQISSESAATFCPIANMISVAKIRGDCLCQY